MDQRTWTVGADMDRERLAWAAHERLADSAKERREPEARPRSAWVLLLLLVGIVLVGAAMLYYSVATGSSAAASVQVRGLVLDAPLPSLDVAIPR